MQNKVVLAFDKDDTLTATGQYILNGLHTYADANNHAGIKRYLEKYGNLSTMLHPQWLKDITWNEIIKPGTYMLEADATALVYRDRLLERVVDLRDNVLPVGALDIVVCSHRGFHKLGLRFTETWLDDRNMLDSFDAIHMLDSKDHPNKVEFLKKEYPGAKILLLDDNPLHDFVTPHPKMDELVVVDVEHSLPGYMNQTKYQNPKQILDMVVKLLEE